MVESQAVLKVILSNLFQTINQCCHLITAVNTNLTTYICFKWRLTKSFTILKEKSRTNCSILKRKRRTKETFKAIYSDM